MFKSSYLGKYNLFKTKKLPSDRFVSINIVLFELKLVPYTWLSNFLCGAFTKPAPCDLQ